MLEVFASSIRTNQSSDLRDTKYLHNIISDLQNVIKSKEQIINLLRNDMKTLQDQLNVTESNTWKSESSISHKIINIKPKLKTRIVALKISIDLLRWLLIYIHLIKIIQQKMTSKMSLKAVLLTTQIIHQRRKDQRNREN